MKKQMTIDRITPKRSGFTLVETAIALGMVAVMISSFVVVFGPAIQGINKSLSSKDADRLTNALELELGVLRNGDTHSSTFDKGFWWIKQSPTTSKKPVLVYQYRGNPDSVRTDGTLNPYPYNATNPGIPGKDYVIQTSVRRLNDTVDNSKIQAELAPGVLEGKVYCVRFFQLRTNTTDGSLEMPWNYWHVYNAGASSMTGDFSQFVDPVLVFRVKFYEVKPPIWSFINNTWTVSPDTETPILTKNMAVMR